jgi:hypothetical protein
VFQPDLLSWTNWLWAWQNPSPEKAVAGLRIEPKNGAIVLSAVTAGAFLRCRCAGTGDGKRYA